MSKKIERKSGAAVRVRRIVRRPFEDIGKSSSQSSSFLGLFVNSLAAPWLNLLWFLPLSLARQRDQSIPVFRYAVRQEICDIPQAYRIVQESRAQLKEIFPDSFLFREHPVLIDYRNDGSRNVSLESLANLNQQMTDVDFSGPIAEEKTLAELAREAWLRTRKPMPHMKLAEAGDEWLLPEESRLELTWLMNKGVLLPESVWPSNAPHKPRGENL